MKVEHRACVTADGDRPSPPDRRTLAPAACRTSDRRREQLIEQHLPLVRALARAFAGRGEQLDDLVQVGSIGLIKAVDRFDPGRGRDLVAYAVPTIRGEIRRYLRDRAAPVRVPRTEQSRGSAVIALPLADDRDGLPPAGLATELEVGESRALLREGMRALDVRERRIVHLRYFGDLSQSGIAAQLGLSQTHVSRLLRGSLEKLRVEIGAR
jgi:RNA polymerase sigma-B factor